jgi:hypothetical protein
MYGLTKKYGYFYTLKNNLKGWVNRNGITIIHYYIMHYILFPLGLCE